uniref:VDE lipocalin domain-containing protein n=1 Tax=Bombyx mori TaxID=7091 RepID=A0A8R2LUN9_BOMMO|nr:uncharacterized protein LOC101739113 isoform X1 [Bombyx mori]
MSPYKMITIPFLLVRQHQWNNRYVSLVSSGFKTKNTKNKKLAFVPFSKLTVPGNENGEVFNVYCVFVIFERGDRKNCKQKKVPRGASCTTLRFARDGTIEWTPGVTMNFTYRFADDPIGETLFGNITWKIDLNQPAHWTHAESTYDGIYNTYVIDTEYKTWALLLHCAEQTEGARYLTAFVLSRTTKLQKNVMAYLRDKLPRFEVDINYVFAIPHDDCAVKPPNPNFGPLMLDAQSKKLIRPSVSYKVFGH